MTKLARSWVLSGLVLVGLSACGGGLASADSQAPRLVAQRQVFNDLVNIFDAEDGLPKVSTGFETVGDCGSALPGDGVSIWMQLRLRSVEPVAEAQFRRAIDDLLDGTDQGDRYRLSPDVGADADPTLGYSVALYDNGNVRWADLTWSTECFSRQSLADAQNAPASWFDTEEAFEVEPRDDVIERSIELGE